MLTSTGGKAENKEKMCSDSNFLTFPSVYFMDHSKVSVMKPNHALSLINASRLDTSSGQVSFVCDEISALLQAN